MFELNQIAGDGRIVLIGYQAMVLSAARTGTDAASRLLLIGQLMTNVVTTTERLVKLNRRLKALFTIVAATTRSIVLPDLLQ